MILCKECHNKTCLKTGKACKKIEEYLKSLGIYKSDWRGHEASHHKYRGYKNKEVPIESIENMCITSPEYGIIKEILEKWELY